MELLFEIPDLSRLKQLIGVKGPVKFGTHFEKTQLLKTWLFDPDLGAQ